MRRTLLLTLFAVLSASLSGQTGTRSGIHREDMDPTCQPCADFWRYVNGGWIDKNPIPARASSWGTFTVLTDANLERLRAILEAAKVDRTAAPRSNVRKMGDFYASCMDTAHIDALGLAPLEPDFRRIAAIQSKQDLAGVLSGFQRVGRPFGSNNGVVVGAFRITSGPDPANPSRVIARLVERDGAGRVPSSILSLPDRDYYLKTDAKSRELRDAFLQHVAKLLELAGTPAAVAAQQAKVVMAFETALAESVMNNVDRRDPDKVYHLMDVGGLNALTPDFDWALLLHAVGLPASTPVNVAEPELLKKFNAQLTAVPLDDWKLWLRWRVLKTSAPYLATPIAAEEQHFSGTVLNGVQEARPRWQTCATVIDRDLSDVLGQAYVEKYFPLEAKRRMLSLVENLRAAMREEIENVAWMTPATKKNAIAKLDALRVRVGYPDAWRDYSALTVNRQTYFENVRAAWTLGQRYEIAKIGKPVSDTDWSMTPPTVNANSNAVRVEITFPAGILQPPFFDAEADDAANYAAIGAVIGHEMGHQFDDGGSKFDATGELKNWWAPEDRKEFEARAACVVDQFNTLDVGEGLHHNGKLVLGEALGDLGGLQTAYKAYQRLLGGKPGPVLDGFTADQRFFIAFARIWGTQLRPEAMRLQLNTNPHPLSKFRANGTLQNMPEFQRAFQCKAGEAMVRPPRQQCRLW
jgi:endothelin-converting enzyme/putative endopeptidase